MDIFAIVNGYLSNIEIAQQPIYLGKVINCMHDQYCSVHVNVLFRFSKTMSLDDIISPH